MSQPAKTSKRTRITTDLAELFVGDHVRIGSQEVPILPLGFRQTIIITKQLKALVAELKEQGIDWSLFDDVDDVDPKDKKKKKNDKSPITLDAKTEQMITLATMLMEQFPDLLEEVSNIALEDLQELPLPIIVQIVSKVVEVNMKSKENLVKNFKSLTDLFSPKKDKTKE